MSVEALGDVYDEPVEELSQTEGAETLSPAEEKSHKTSLSILQKIGIAFGFPPKDLPEEIKILSREPSKIISSVDTGWARFEANAIPEEVQRENMMVFVFLVIKMMYDGQTEHNTSISKAQEEYKLNRQKKRTRELMDQSATTISTVAQYGAIAAMFLPMAIGSDTFRDHVLYNLRHVPMLGQHMTRDMSGTVQKICKAMFAKDAFQKVNSGIQTTQALNQGLTSSYQTEQQLTMQKVQKAGERSSGASQDQQRAGQMAQNFRDILNRISMSIASPNG